MQEYGNFHPYEPLHDDYEGTESTGPATWSSGATTNAAVPGRPHRNKRIIKWLILHSSGEKQILTLDKRHVIQAFNLDIPSRDMRLMDTHLAFNLDIPSRDMRLMDTHLVNYDTIGQLLVRENALVFSMEHVRLIIMADKYIVSRALQSSPTLASLSDQLCSVRLGASVQVSAVSTLVKELEEGMALLESIAQKTEQDSSEQEDASEAQELLHDRVAGFLNRHAADAEALSQLEEDVLLELRQLALFFEEDFDPRDPNK
eukprot:gene2215-33775_t